MPSLNDELNSLKTVCTTYRGAGTHTNPNNIFNDLETAISIFITANAGDAVIIDENSLNPLVTALGTAITNNAPFDTDTKKINVIKALALLQQKLTEYNKAHAHPLAISLGNAFDAFTPPATTWDIRLKRLENALVSTAARSLTNIVDLGQKFRNLKTALGNTAPSAPVDTNLVAALTEIGKKLTNLADDNAKKECALALVKLQTELLTFAERPGLADNKVTAAKALAKEMGKTYDWVVNSLTNQNSLSTQSRLERFRNEVKLADTPTLTALLQQELITKIETLIPAIPDNANVNNMLNQVPPAGLNSCLADGLDTDAKKRDVVVPLNRFSNALIEINTASSKDLARTLNNTFNHLAPPVSAGANQTYVRSRLNHLKNGINLATGLPQQTELATALDQLITAGINNNLLNPLENNDNINNSLAALSNALANGFNTPQKKKEVSIALINLSKAFSNLALPIAQANALINELGKSFDALAPQEAPHALSTQMRLERLRQAVKISNPQLPNLEILCGTLIASNPADNANVNKAVNALCIALAKSPPDHKERTEQLAAFAHALTKNYPEGNASHVTAKAMVNDINQFVNREVGAGLAISPNARVQHLATVVSLLPKPIPPATGINPTTLSAAIEKLIGFGFNANVENAIKELTTALIPEPTTDPQKLTAIAKLKALENLLQQNYGANNIATELCEQLKQARNALVPPMSALATDAGTLLGRSNILKNALTTLPADPATAFEQSQNALTAFTNNPFPGAPQTNNIQTAATTLRTALQTYQDAPLTTAPDNKQALTTALNAFKALADSDTATSLNVLGRRIESHYRLATTLKNMVTALGTKDTELEIDTDKTASRDAAIAKIFGTDNFKIESLTKHEARKAYFALEKQLTHLYGNIDSHTKDDDLKAIMNGMKALREAYQIPTFRPSPMRDNLYEDFLKSTLDELKKALENKKYLANPQELANVEKLISQYENIAAALYAHRSDLQHQLDTSNFIVLGERRRKALSDKIGNLDLLLDRTINDIDTTVNGLRKNIETLKITGQTHITKYADKLEQVANDDTARQNGINKVLDDLGAGVNAPVALPAVALGGVVHEHTKQNLGDDKAIVIGGKITTTQGTAAKTDDIHFNADNRTLEVHTRFHQITHNAAGAPIPLANQVSDKMVLKHASQEIDLNENKRMSFKNIKHIPNKNLLDEFANTVAQMLAKSSSLRRNREIEIARNVDLCPSEFPTKAYLLCLELAGIKYKYTEYKDNKEVPERDRVKLSDDDRAAFHLWISKEMKGNTLASSFESLLSFKQEKNKLVRTPAATLVSERPPVFRK